MKTSSDYTLLFTIFTIVTCINNTLWLPILRDQPSIKKIKLPFKTPLNSRNHLDARTVIRIEWPPFGWVEGWNSRTRFCDTCVSVCFRSVQIITNWKGLKVIWGRVNLGGGNSKMFYVHPELWGRFTFWLIFFRWVETTDQVTLILSNLQPQYIPNQKERNMIFLKQKEPDIMAFFSRHSIRLTWIHEKISSFLFDVTSNQTNDPPSLSWQKCPPKYFEFVWFLLDL